MTTTIDLTAITTTGATRQVITTLTQAGLNPHYGPDGTQPYRGTVAVLFDEGTPNGVFGAVIISARTGRIVRSEITFGNHGDTRELTGYQQIHTAISSLLAANRTVGEAA